MIEDDVRRYLIKRFPYGIYYTLENDAVIIWAVKHLHRNPDYWQHRHPIDSTSPLFASVNSLPPKNPKLCAQPLRIPNSNPNLRL
jgi:hypothetical protein